nr:hypothetical protein CFP56_23896 [Quercus suber]
MITHQGQSSKQILQGEMATSRLRRAFQYPEEHEDSPDELDEEHQESLIAALQAADAQKSSLYRKLFLSIPLTAAIYFTYTLLFASRTAQQRLLALLSVTSLLSTSYVLQYLPVQTPDRKGKRAVYQLEAAKSPVERYLVCLNAALAGLLVLVSAVSWWKGLREQAWKEALPGIIMGLSMVVRELLAPLDLEDLQKAKYDYKARGEKPSFKLTEREQLARLRSTRRLSILVLSVSGSPFPSLSGEDSIHLLHNFAAFWLVTKWRCSPLNDLPQRLVTLSSLGLNNIN